MIKEFKEFLLRGNLLDLAVAVVIGAAFTAVIASIAACPATRPIGILRNFSTFNFCRGGRIFPAAIRASS